MILASHGIPLEEIHTMLDTVTRDLERLRSVGNGHSAWLDMSYVEDSVGVLHELRAYGALPHLGINPSLMTKLINFDARVRAATIQAALERTRTFLKAEESDFRGDYGPETAEEATERSLDGGAEPSPSPAPVAVWAERWVYVQPRSRAKQVILELSELLDEALLLASQTNLPEEQAAMTKLERQQLIALLETALAVLSAPMIEPGLLKKLKKAAAEVSQNAAKKQAELALGGLATGIAGLIAKLLGYL